MADAIQLSEAINALQKAQLQLGEAVAAIGAHNQAELAHPLILRLIEDLKHSEAVWSRAQIRDLAEDVLKAHAELNIRVAHEGFTDIIGDITTRLSKLEADVEILSDKVNGVANHSASKLERAIQAIEDKYAPVLVSLQSTLNDAELIQDRNLADSIKSQISETLGNKRTEIVEAIEIWSQEQRGN